MNSRPALEIWIVIAALVMTGMTTLLAWQNREATVVLEQLRLRIGELPQVVQGDPNCGCLPQCRCCRCMDHKE